MQEISLKNSLPAIFLSVLNLIPANYLFVISRLDSCPAGKITFLRKDDSLHLKCCLEKFTFCNAELVQDKMIGASTACSSVFFLSKLK